MTFTAGTGMRQGEVFGLTVDRIDFLRREVRVDRSCSLGRTADESAAQDASERPHDPACREVVVDELAAHLAEHPVGEHGLVFTMAGEPITRQAFGHVWRPVARAGGSRRARDARAPALLRVAADPFR